MVPADLERRLVEAKQKVMLCTILLNISKKTQELFNVLVIVQGFVPFFVSATAGTTVYGAFDPLNAISEICKKYNVWMHVDVSKPKKTARYF